MEEEGSNNQVESEKVEPEDADDNKDFAIERITIARGRPKISSRYLSGQNGSSCHDMCKYGTEHTKKAKKRVVIREGKTKIQEEYAAATSSAGTKKSGRKSKPSRIPKVGDRDSLVDIKEVTDEKTFNLDNKSPPFEETHASMEHNNSEPRQAVKESSKSHTKTEKAKSISGFGSSSIKKTRIPMPTTTVPLSSEHKGKKPSSSNAKISKNLKSVSSPLKHRAKNVEVAKPEPTSNDTTSEKILHVIEPSDESKLSSLPSPSPSRAKILKQARKKIDNSGPSSSRKGLRHVTHPSAPASLPRLSSKSNSKIQHIVSRPTSIQSASSSIISRGKHSSASTPKSNKTRNGDQGENVKVGYKMRPRMSTIVAGANKVGPSMKLTFRRGKVIEIQPQSHNVARRLKFRPVRRLADDVIHRHIIVPRARATANKESNCGSGVSNAVIAKPERVVSRIQGTEGGKKRSVYGRKVGGDKSKLDVSKPDQKVVLRHQNVEEKKLNPRLYNNVIEETASMLAELRKSKVKALVGAFETVISLDSPREATREATPSEVSMPC